MSFYNPSTFQCNCNTCKEIEREFNNIDREVKKWMLEGDNVPKAIKKTKRAIKLIRKIEFDDWEAQYLSGIYITRLLWWERQDLNVWKQRWGIQDNCIRCHKKEMKENK